MKRLGSLSLLLLALVLMTLPGNAAGLAFTVSVDEFGNGSSTFPGGPNALPSFIAPDPSGGVAGNVLQYLLLPNLPFTPGDVILDENVGTNLVVSDVLRFFPTANGTLLLFYSDNGDGVDAPADISGLPGNVIGNPVHVLEIGPDGNNGAVYTPIAGQPGFVSTDFMPTFNIISDAPEPASFLLIGAGLAALGFRKFRRAA